MLLKKGLQYAYRDRKNKKRTLELFGYRGLMQEPDYTGCHTQNLWEKF